MYTRTQLSLWLDNAYKVSRRGKIRVTIEVLHQDVTIFTATGTKGCLHSDTKRNDNFIVVIPLPITNHGVANVAVHVTVGVREAITPQANTSHAPRAYESTNKCKLKFNFSSIWVQLRKHIQ